MSVHLLVIISPINCHVMHGVRHKIESLLGSLQVILKVWSLCIRVLCTTLQNNPTDGDGRLWVLLRTLCYSSGFGLRVTLKGWSLQSNVVFSFRLAPFHYKNVVECNAFLLIALRTVTIGLATDVEKGDRLSLLQRAFCASNSSCWTCAGTGKTRQAWVCFRSSDS